MKYICPSCDKEMINNNSDNYECIDCDLYYLTPYKSIKGSLGKRTTPLIFGDFDYCCRVYKLKAFS